MMYDIKYHVASLVAVFLAIALGMFIGSALDGNGSIVQKQETIVQSLKADFDKLSLENKNLQTNNKELKKAETRTQQFGSRILPALVSNKLKGKKIMLVDCGGTTGNQQVSSTLVLAGATIVKEIVFTDKFAVAALSVTKNSSSASALQSADRDSQLSDLSAKLVDECFNGTQSDTAKKLIEKEALAMQVTDSAALPDVVVVIGGYPTAVQAMTDFIDRPIIRSLAAAGHRVVGVETSDVGYSSTAEYKKLGISTVDNVDAPYGQISLVYVVAGWEGHYGEKPEADKLMPEKITPGVLVN